MRLFLIRHGQTTGDIEERYGGIYNDHLTDPGREQSKAVSQQLRGQDIHCVYSSPLIRAMETAGIIAGILSVPHYVLSDFREHNRYGILSGLTKAEASAIYPDQVPHLATHDGLVTGAEPIEEFRERVVRAFDRLCMDEEGQTIALVTHGGVFRLFFREILELGVADVSDTGLAILEYGIGGWQLVDLSGVRLKKITGNNE